MLGDDLSNGLSFYGKILCIRNTLNRISYSKGKTVSISENNLPSAKRRLIYLIAFPAGAALISVFVMLNRQQFSTASLLFGFGVAAILLLFEIFLLFRIFTLKLVETAFYLILMLTIPIFVNTNLNNYTTISRITPEYLSEVVNGMALWETIFFVGIFLSIPRKTFLILVSTTLVLIIVVGLRNLWLLHEAGNLEAIYVFHWVHIIFALGILFFLILRIGGIQHQRASLDQLTGALNRHEAIIVLNSLYEQAVRFQSPFSLILIDIDHFKEVNDTYGHPTGDNVLIEFTRIITDTIRKQDYLVRWGGEEFLVLLPNEGMSGAKITADRVREAVSNGDYHEDITITASFGVTTYEAGLTVGDLLSNMDEALYRAKAEGRNMVIPY
jgi:diguanylate cyclase (GGDEF)-like protein